MGMFDTVVCRYPLPHHQDAAFQTKDLAAVALGEHFLSGLLDEYEITADRRLRRHVHEREWTADPEAFLGGYMRSVRDWWEDMPDAHGDVVMYTTDDVPGEQRGRWVEFRVRFTNGRVQEVHEVQTREEDETRPADPTALPADVAGEQQAPDADDRPEVQALLGRLKAEVGTLGTLLRECSGHWGYEDPIYRFYHQSFKVYALQRQTSRIVAALESLRPGHPLDEGFRRIVADGTGRTFAPDDNRRWLEATRPIVEAFFHARFFLELAVRYGRRLDAPPRVLPSGWAALLELYGLR
ncbi:MAG: hypothetical protein R6V57_06295 [Vicinamibacterales bacterium]